MAERARMGSVVDAVGAVEQGSGRVAGGVADPLDDIDQSLRQVRSLVDIAIREHQRSAACDVVQLAVDEHTAARHRRRIASAALETLLYCPPAGSDAQSIVANLLAARGDVPVDIRVLCTGDPAGLANPAVAAETRVNVRIATTSLPELLIADGRLALVRPQAGPMLLVRAPALVATLLALADLAWQSAQAPRWPPAPDLAANGSAVGGGAEPGGVAAAILATMLAGHKDAAAARQLGLSIRQYRRYVADLMRDIGATSRFQAGARAAELGLLSNGHTRGGTAGAGPISR